MARGIKISLCALCCLFLLGFSLIGSVPAFAAADGAMSAQYYSYYRFSCGFSLETSNGDHASAYSQELISQFSNNASIYRYFTAYPLQDAFNYCLDQSYRYTGSGDTVRKCISDFGFTPGTKCTYFTLNSMEPIFVDNDEDGMPFLEITNPDVDMRLIVRISGSYLIETSSPSSGTFTRELQPFTYTASENVGASELFEISSVFNEADGPDADAIIYSISVTCLPVSSNEWFDTISINTYVVPSSAIAQNVIEFVDSWKASFQAQFPSYGGDISDVSFVDWIVEAVSAFWDFELFPGFSIEGIVYGVMGIALVFLFLRFFAGG